MATFPESIIEEIRSLDSKELPKWIQTKLSIQLKLGDDEKFLDAEIDGKAFLDLASDKDLFINVFMRAGLSLGISGRLAQRASNIIRRKRDIERAGLAGLDTASKRRRVEGETESSNRKRLQLSPLPGSNAIYETKSAVVRCALSFQLLTCV
jgi:hypothetical protein